MKLKKLIKLLDPNEKVIIHVLNKTGDWEKNKFYGKVKHIPHSLSNCYIMNDKEDMRYAINFRATYDSQYIEILCDEPIV